MKVSTIMNLACVRLDVNSKDFAKVVKYSSDATVLYSGTGEEKVPEYIINLSTCSEMCCIESFDNMGANFVDVKGTPVLWVCLPDAAFEDKAGYITDVYGNILSNIATIEKQIKREIAVVNEKVNALQNNISDVFDVQDDENTVNRY